MPTTDPMTVKLIIQRISLHRDKLSSIANMDAEEKMKPIGARAHHLLHFLALERQKIVAVIQELELLKSGVAAIEADEG